MRFEELDTHCIASMHEFKLLHNALFPNTDASLEWLLWYFSMGMKHQNEQTRAYVAIDDNDDLVGMWCVEPKTLVLTDGKFVPVGRCFSVGIHADHRRKNLFTELSCYAIEQERTRGTHEHIIGFPQVGRPVTAAHLKSGWERVQTIAAYSHAVTKPATMTSLRCVTKVFNAKLLNSTYVSYGGFYETPEYREDRWFNHPDHSYTCLQYKTAYVVTKQYNSTCHVLDMNGTMTDLITALEGTKTLAYRHNASEITSWCAENEVHKPALEAAGFTNGAKGILPIDVLAVRIKALQALELDRCVFGMGVEEIY